MQKFMCIICTCNKCRNVSFLKEKVLRPHRIWLLKQQSAENSKTKIVPTWILHLKETSASSLFGSLRPAELKNKWIFPLYHIWIWNNNYKNHICSHLWPYGHFVVLPQKADACFQNRCLVHLPIIWTHLHTLVQDKKNILQCEFDSFHFWYIFISY